MRKSEQNRPGGGKRVKFDTDVNAAQGDNIVVTEKNRQGGGKHVRFDKPASPTPPSNPPSKGGAKSK